MMENQMNEKERVYNVLSREKELELFNRYRLEDDQDAYVEIIYSNLNLIREYITQFCENNSELEDLIQDGYLVLLNAIESYDYTKNDQFNIYLIKCIDREILQGEKEESIINDELSFVIEEFITTLAQKEVIQRCFSLLSPREIKVLQLRHGLEDGNCRTFSEIGKLFGVTGERARMIQKNAFLKIRKAIARVHYEDEILFKIDEEGIPYHALTKMKKKKKKFRRKCDVVIWGKLV